jgi:hypothetical protein
LEVKQIIDPFIKAIAIVKTYKSKDEFLDAWNEFYHNSADQLDCRFVYFGYVQDRYIGWNSPFNKKINRDSQRFVQLTNRQLGKNWDLCLMVWADAHFISLRLYNEFFNFGF